MTTLPLGRTELGLWSSPATSIQPFACRPPASHPLSSPGDRVGVAAISGPVRRSGTPGGWSRRPPAFRLRAGQRYEPRFPHRRRSLCRQRRRTSQRLPRPRRRPGGEGHPFRPRRSRRATSAAADRLGAAGGADPGPTSATPISPRSCSVSSGASAWWPSTAQWWRPSWPRAWTPPSATAFLERSPAASPARSRSR